MQGSVQIQKGNISSSYTPEKHPSHPTSANGSMSPKRICELRKEDPSSLHKQLLKNSLEKGTEHCDRTTKTYGQIFQLFCLCCAGAAPFYRARAFRLQSTFLIYTLHCSSDSVSTSTHYFRRLYSRRW
ncbi:hypothetical protein [Treponema pallidum]|uniref:Uncharacterized protein TP_0355 n=4 Tax=Treponema pallidum TaxID=160 RepID=Y355_TREPA|nr:hypothetical protein [Treponema pallidum]O83374.1 RecName: Full=Uncharacterized protein TP_0355 [Treponema pallidum subsp. pallidum str. Nichols]AAC65353.1 predicted coding region TP0355 [Treponema pallidum subsp. pallidum str. Nichols]ACD70781.1 hypothetical protein TPASS_0355 [Treponema pallidum subsp. pallidum SS14]AEZ57474.1 hypothetical protein TPESAMD_0355 [Treponema pallidum subsp. pertenue str. SamoaD]AEZ58543.1 hypothetical protein TPECDC2_0355 [Treponema pallidum subsp. pertenue s